MDEIADPRLTFAGRMQSLREAAGLSIRQLEIESARTLRRRPGQPPIRLKRATIADMISRRRPVRPEPDNFEVFVDTCLRVAAEHQRTLPDGLGDRRAWDAAYRQLRDHTDRYRRPADPPSPARQPADETSPEPAPRQDLPPHGGHSAPADEPLAAVTAQPPTARPAWNQKPLATRRQILLAASLVMATSAAAPFLLRRGPASTAGHDPGAATGPPSRPGYRREGTLLSPPAGLDNPVWSVAVATVPDPPVALVGRADGTVQLWDPVTGAARAGPLAGHGKPVYSIALARPVAVSAGVDGTLRLWDLTATPPTSRVVGEPLAGGINGVALGTVRGSIVAVTAGDDRTVRTWHLAVPQTVGRVLGHRLDSPVNSIAATTVNGSAVAVSGSADGSIHRWDLETGQAADRLGAHRAAVWAMATGTVGGRTFAVSGSEDGEIRTWDLSAPAPFSRTLGRVILAVKSIAIATVEGRTVAICGSDDAAIRIWDLATGEPYGDGLTGPATAAESIATAVVDGQTLVISGHWDGTIWTWRL